jgi:hypothetical protein
MVTIFLTLFRTAQSAMTKADWPTVKLVRTMYGERSTTIDAAETITIVGIFASVTNGAMVNADGVTPTPRIATLSLTIISCASRFATSGEVASSLTMPCSG